MPLKLVPDNTNIGFVRLRFLAFGLTLLLTLGSIGLLATRGLNLGVDFVGGLTMETPRELEKLRAQLVGLELAVTRRTRGVYVDLFLEGRWTPQR